MQQEGNSSNLPKKLLLENSSPENTPSSNTMGIVLSPWSRGAGSYHSGVPYYTNEEL